MRRLAAGFRLYGGATVQLSDDGAGTLLTYDAEAKVGGKMAQLGSRLIDGFARKLADEFFTRFQETVEGPPPESAEEDGAVEAETGGEAPEENKKGWFRRLFG